MSSVVSSHQDCKPCKRKLPVTGGKSYAGWSAGILLALLPKCPFCMLAYTCTAVLCGAGTTTVSSRTYASAETFIVTSFFSVLVLLSIVLNNRGWRTRRALLLVVSGIVCCLVSVIWIGGSYLYFTGVGAIFSGVWLNGSLLYFIRRVFGKIDENATVAIPTSS